MKSAVTYYYVFYFGVLLPVARILSQQLFKVYILYIFALAGHLQAEYTVISGSCVFRLKMTSKGRNM
jgi:hypothetical protein